MARDCQPSDSIPSKKRAEAGWGDKEEEKERVSKVRVPTAPPHRPLLISLPLERGRPEVEAEADAEPAPAPPPEPNRWCWLILHTASPRPPTSV